MHRMLVLGRKQWSCEDGSGIGKRSAELAQLMLVLRRKQQMPESKLFNVPALLDQQSMVESCTGKITVSSLCRSSPG